MTNDVMRLGSLCTGAGGLELGLALAGVRFELEWVADPDPAATAVLAAHHPGVRNLGDIRSADWSSAGPIDLLTAGFPCQDISLAGRRAGLLPGNRSGLWLHVAEAIDVLRPRLVFLENVRGILSAAASTSDLEFCPWCVGCEQGKPALRALGAVLGDLATCGYDASWYCLPAAEIGAPHLRWRCFILAWPASEPPRFRNGHAAMQGGQGLAPAEAANGLGAAELLPTPTASRYGRNRSVSSGAAIRPGLEMIGDLLPTPAARDGGPRGMSSPKRAAQRTAAGHALNLEDALALLPTPRATEGTKGSPASRGAKGDLSLSSAVQPQHWGKFADAIARWETATGRAAPAATMPGPRGGVRLSPSFVEWMTGLAPGYVTAYTKRNDALRLLGNIAVPLQVAAAIPPLLSLSSIPSGQLAALAAV